MLEIVGFESTHAFTSRSQITYRVLSLETASFPQASRLVMETTNILIPSCLPAQIRTVYVLIESDYSLSKLSRIATAVKLQPHALSVVALSRREKITSNQFYILLTPLGIFFMYFLQL